VQIGLEGMEVNSMFNPLDYPILMFAVLLPAFWFAAWVGNSFAKGKQAAGEDDRDEFMFVLGGTLTLLGLIIAFTFSMAVTRYDQRKDYEEQEANAIGTEYVRADLLSAADAPKVRALLKNYLDQRILQYTTGNEQKRRQVEAQIAKLQTEMWSAVVSPSAGQLSPVTALTVVGMNDVLNSQGYTQAAWWNRIPAAAWALMIVISILCNFLVGYGAHGRRPFMFLLLPLALSISLFLVAEIDSPRTGLIHVHPQNLESLAESLHP
jgi:hypothetical protein